MTTAQVHRYVCESSRESRVEFLQRSRVFFIKVLTLMTLIEFAVVLAAYYIPFPTWLVVVNLACILCNVPIIYWLGALYFEDRKKNRAIEKQSRIK